VIVVSRSIHIDAPVERVFALMADPATRARLNPGETPLMVDIENGAPLRQGSVCHYRLQHGRRILDYRMRVHEFMPNRRILSTSDSAVPFEVRIETAPEGGGTRLTQTESFEANDAILREALSDNASSNIVGLVQRFFTLIDPEAVLTLRRRQEEQLTKILEDRMDDWLIAIRAYLEGAADETT
jgi:uncharacterized protein YndB with AHSA1/START domain